MTDDSDASGWYSVRCLFLLGWPPEVAGRAYEERITMWRADSIDHAIARAEAEAQQYAAAVSDGPSRYLEFAQAYSMEGPPKDGAEIFSLVRVSDQGPGAYLDHFFDTGEEHQQHA